MNVLEKIKQYKNKNGLTQCELARVLEVAESQLSRWLAGIHKISRGSAALIEQKID